MSRILSILLGGLVLAASPALAGMQPILQLEKMVDDEATHVVTLYASDIDPNSSATDDSYRLTVNGQKVDIPDALSARLDRERRGYSYDAFTKGVSEETAKAMCMMAGPARGTVLSVLYLTYENDQIADAAMRPILTRPDNCLFTKRIRPVSDEARFEAAGAMATLQTILDLHAN
jgi:hypothetical protein